MLNYIMIRYREECKAKCLERVECEKYYIKRYLIWILFFAIMALNIICTISNFDWFNVLLIAILIIILVILDNFGDIENKINRNIYDKSKNGKYEIDKIKWLNEILEENGIEGEKKITKLLEMYKEAVLEYEARTTKGLHLFEIVGVVITVLTLIFHNIDLTGISNIYIINCILAVIIIVLTLIFSFFIIFYYSPIRNNYKRMIDDIKILLLLGIDENNVDVDKKHSMIHK